MRQGSPHIWKVYVARKDERTVQVLAAPLRNFGLLLSLGLDQMPENHEKVAEQPQTLSTDKGTEEQSTDLREADAGGRSSIEHEIDSSTAIADNLTEGVSEAADFEGYAGQDFSEGVEESQTLVADQGIGEKFAAADVGGHAGAADQNDMWQDETGSTAKDCDMHALPLLAQADCLWRLADMVDTTLKDLKEAIIRLQDNSGRDARDNVPVPAPIGKGLAEALQRSNQRVLSSSSDLNPGGATQEGQRATLMQQSVDSLAERDMQVAEKASESSDRPSVDEASVQQAGLEGAEGVATGDR
eukprot:SM000076S21784  [mRNA]  locus=s76:177569:179570:+ [translate_table: standard]